MIERNYRRIFTARVRNAILRQRFEKVFGNYQGVMIGDGAVWFDHTCVRKDCKPPLGPIKIRTVNRQF